MLYLWVKPTKVPSAAQDGSSILVFLYMKMKCIFRSYLVCLSWAPAVYARASGLKMKDTETEHIYLHQYV